MGKPSAIGKIMAELNCKLTYQRGHADRRSFLK